MTAKERYIKLFGPIMDDLAKQQPWTMGVVGLLEHFTWGTSNILGVSKTKLIEMVVQMSDSEAMSGLSSEEKVKQIQSKLRRLQEKSEKTEPYDKKCTGYCTSREALRRNRYFSEEYLNAEFNIFLSLCSNKYLNSFYGKYIDLKGVGSWSTHGNGDIFQHSSGMNGKMQMDNLAYNEEEMVFVANELKLGGKKNKDQILKYCFMYNSLESNGLIKKECKYLLLFISDKNEQIDLEKILKDEKKYVATLERLH